MIIIIIIIWEKIVRCQAFKSMYTCVRCLNKSLIIGEKCYWKYVIFSVIVRLVSDTLHALNEFPRLSLSWFKIYFYLVKTLTFRNISRSWIKCQQRNRIVWLLFVKICTVKIKNILFLTRCSLFHFTMYYKIYSGRKHRARQPDRIRTGFHAAMFTVDEGPLRFQVL